MAVEKKVHSISLDPKTEAKLLRLVAADMSSKSAAMRKAIHHLHDVTFNGDSVIEFKSAE